LNAPGVAAAGIDLDRLLVVRPPRAQLGRVAVKVTGAGAFEVVVVDFDAVPGAAGVTSQTPAQSLAERKRTAPAERKKATGAERRKAWSPDVLVRKLALSAESNGATVLLLTDSVRPRAVPWPVALRLELARPNRDEILVRVAKDRRGRVGVAKAVPFAPLARMPSSDVSHRAHGV
jgi:recombination protein RecA